MLFHSTDKAPKPHYKTKYTSHIILVFNPNQNIVNPSKYIWFPHHNIGTVCIDTCIEIWQSLTVGLHCSFIALEEATHFNDKSMKMNASQKFVTFYRATELRRKSTALSLARSTWCLPNGHFLVPPPRNILHSSSDERCWPQNDTSVDTFPPDYPPSQRL